MKKKVIYSAVFHFAYPFADLGEKVEVAIEPTDLKEQDSMLIVWGGADIDPAFYRHPIHKTTHPGGRRDRVEWGLMMEAKERGIPIIGVCRGAQMLCALSGGFLLQDVQNHAGPHHFVATHDNEVLDVNSLHHQMMCVHTLPKEDYELLAWREGNKGAPYGYRDDKTFNPPAGWKEPEFVYFKKTKGYAIQWHPEMMPIDSEATEYVLKFVNKQEEENGAGFAFRTLETQTP